MTAQSALIDEPHAHTSHGLSSTQLSPGATPDSWFVDINMHRKIQNHFDLSKHGMRVLRAKQIRKTLKFFQITYNVQQPFKIILDGNFIVVCLKMQLDPANSIRKVQTRWCDCFRRYNNPWGLNRDFPVTISWIITKL